MAAFKYKFQIAVTAALLLVALAYSNHFHNAFHFDDIHTIENNVFIRDLSNFKLFFTSAQTHSSLPSNQAYRPMHTLSVAIDYKLAGGTSDTFWFHCHAFIYYLVQLVLMFLLLKKIAGNFMNKETAKWMSLLAVVFYGVHTANAETINYISARSDSFSTTWMLASFCLFIYFPAKRKYLLYLIPFCISFLFKPVTIVFPVLLFFYLWFFESQHGISEFFAARRMKDLFKVVIQVTPLGIVCIILYWLQNRLTAETFTPGGSSAFKYIISQPYVMLHYFRNFFFPAGLSADTDWTVLQSIADWRFWLGLVFLSALLALVYRTSKTMQLRPIAFGLIWFLMALLPTSLIPLAEVLNDHRPFFPYIGLLIAFATFVYLVLRNRSTSDLKAGALIFMLLIATHVYGTWKRNAVWHTPGSLWKDVTEKSPANGRGWMNYGLTFMSKGDYAKAEEAFNKALNLLPQYSFLHINFGVLYANTGRKALAEKYFTKALLLDESNPECYYFFADYMYKEKRPYDARVLIEKGLKISPAHLFMRYLLMNAYYDLGEMNKLKDLCSTTLQLYPKDEKAKQFLGLAQSNRSKADQLMELAAKNTSAEQYLEASLEYYNGNNFQACIDAANNALKIKPDYVQAYNNICSGYNEMGEYEKAIDAADKGLKIMPGYELLKSNRALALRRQKSFKDALDKAVAIPNEDNLIDLSLFYYNMHQYQKCIETCEKVVKINPNSATAYNNLCTSYNMLQQWEKAIAAGEMAVKIKPDFELAKNNLQFAKSKLAK